MTLLNKILHAARDIKLHRKRCAHLLATLIACGVLITPSYAANISNGSSESATDVRTQPIPIRDIQKFATVIAQIKQFYIEPVENKKLFDNAIEGMLTGLDPHSAYLNVDDMKDLQSATTGKFGGVGIEIMPENGSLKVVTPLDDTPASAAGIEPGDQIVRIDKTPVKKMTLREAVKKIRGKVGTEVTLIILRKGEAKPLKFTLKRAIIKIKTVKSRVLENGFGYVRIAVFQEPVIRELKAAITQLKKASGGQLKGLVLDLRNNPGGLLDTAIDVSDNFLDARKLGKNKLIVYTEGRIPRAEIRATATAGELLPNTPLVVLINGGSASASEIVAGALQDHNRAVIIGTKSFGKGSVQTVIPIDYKTGIKLTTALYYTPKGRSIQATGIKPDVVVAVLKIPKTKTEDIVFDPVSEADLDHHLANGNDEPESQKPAIPMKSKAQPKKISAAKKAEDEKFKDLAHNDFQLYEALNLLKGIYAQEH